MYHLSVISNFSSLLLITAVAMLLQPITAVYNKDGTINRHVDLDGMFCNGPLPSGQYGKSFIAKGPGARIAKERLENGIGAMKWSAENFTSLAHLCTAHGNLNGNMGGIVRISTPFCWAIGL
jgi:hypothetical protein